MASIQREKSGTWRVQVRRKGRSISETFVRLLEAPYHGLALTADGRTLCLAGRESDQVALVRAPELSLIATIKVGAAPGWAEIADGGRLCLLPNGRSNDLSFVSIPDRKEVARVAVGRGPRHVRTANIPATVIAEVEARASSKLAN